MFTMRVGRVLKVAVLVAAAAGAPAIWAATDTAASKSDTSGDKMPSSGSAMMKMDPAKVFNMMDADKKGYVTKEEFLKFQERLFGAWDKDKNERLSQQEFLGYP